MILQQASTLTTSQWSGGTTTELAISPAGASYAARDFDWRISTATVETEQSDFTHLPGYDRILMVLEGELKMVHDTGTEQRSVQLQSFEQSSFDGDWKTTGYGKVRDFNVMFRYGKTAVVELKTAEFMLPAAGTTILYCLEGTARINEQLLRAGDVCQSNEAHDVTPGDKMKLLLVHIA